jgi:DNA-directed RNA polymerase specialized sigma24 family protein
METERAGSRLADQPQAASSGRPGVAPSSVARGVAGRSVDERIAALDPLIRRTLERMGVDEVDLDDLTQDVLVRLLKARSRLESRTLPAYAVVVTRNVAHTHRRDDGYRQAKLARAAGVADRSVPGPDETIGDAEQERGALAAALSALSGSDRDLVLGAPAAAPAPAPADDEAGPASLRADPAAPTPGTRRVRLSRARARLRVRFVLALRDVQPASARCLPVLDALAAGDTARQAAIHASEHLASCPSCANVAEEVVSRRRPLLVLIPWVAAALLFRLVRRHPTGSAATAAVVAGVMVAAVASRAGDDVAAPPPVTVPASAATSAPPPTSAPVTAASVLVTPTRSLLPVPADVAGLAGSPVTGSSVPVRAVVGDEAFWVGVSDTDAYLVVFSGPGESPEQIAPGEVVTFTGALQAYTEGVADDAGLTDEASRAQARTMGVYLAVHPADLRSG